MELRQLIYFKEVAKLEHVSQAAESLHVAQSAVSRQISLLEKELGVDLFTRENRSVRLTRIGRLFLEHTEKIIVELEHAKQKVEEYLNPDKGTIRLGFSTTLSIHTLPMVMTQFRSEHPNINFQLHQGTMDYLIKLIERGDIDIALASPVPTNHENIEGKVFFTEKMSALLPKNHQFADNNHLRLIDLRAERFVTFRSGFSLRDIVIKACKQTGFTPEIAFEGEDMDTIKGLVSAGLGIAIIPEHAMAYDTPDMVTVPIVEPEITRSVGAMIPKHRELAPSEHLFFQFSKNFYDRLYRFGQQSDF
ncbi:LysR family transcriptional activator of glutamate synthase operon [Scopulibacillus daqui]|uniref:LysR family transcriptional activator of glutamate synthase operon n=1 Tax=Scopulibacillus daqui TaxID=1469162 RepID=A0ABS2PYH1_9BACL|nr:LysR substrate-binding domain-containing protein [Scopulibacillus daqui]MBM7645099.1 LysR family transcriptional activator of glutamate synthase operon [Scopulibacillus daqui]